MDRVRAIKIESPATGGTQSDTFYKPAKPNQDAPDVRGVFLQNDTSSDSAVYITRDASQNLVFRDSVVGADTTLYQLLNPTITASGVSVVAGNGLAATDAQSAFNEHQSDINAINTNKLDASAYTAADVLSKIKTVDGSGSGLDADTLDGLDSANIVYGDNGTGSKDIYNNVSYPNGSNDITKSGFYRDNRTGGLGYTLHLQHPTSTGYAWQLQTDYPGSKLQMRTQQTSTWGSAVQIWTANDFDPTLFIKNNQATTNIGSGVTSTNVVLNVGNPGVGYYNGFNFTHSSDAAGLYVTEYASDNTMYEFWMSDNPDTSQDFFSWRWTDYQGPNGLYQPFQIANKQVRFIGTDTLCYSNLTQPYTSNFYTTSDINQTNASRKNVNIFNTAGSLKTTGTGTTTITSLDVSGYTGTSGQVFWIILSSATTFDWGYGTTGSGRTAQQTGLAVATTAVTLSNGIKVIFSDTTGGVNGDTFQCRLYKAPTASLSTLTVTGTITATSNIYTNTGWFLTTTLNTSLKLRGNANSGNIANQIGNGTSLYSGKIASFYSDGLVTEQASIDYGGLLGIKGLVLNALSSPSGLTLATATTGGTLAAGTYGYVVTTLGSLSTETTPCAEVTITTTGTTSTVTLTWNAVSGANGYKVYGRTSGGELLMATIAAGTTTWTDTGSVTPSGTLPIINTTGKGLSSGVTAQDIRNTNPTPAQVSTDHALSAQFNNNYGIGSGWQSSLTVAGWTGSNNYAVWQLIGGSNTATQNEWYLRSGVNASWDPFRRIWHDGNLTNLNQLTNGPGYYKTGDSPDFGGLVIGTGTGSDPIHVKTAAYASNVNTGVRVSTSDNLWVARFALKSNSTGVPRTAIDVVADHAGNTTEAVYFGYSGDAHFASTVDTGGNLSENGSRVWTASTLTNLNQLVNGPGYLTANQTITLTGDVTGSGTTSITTTVANAPWSKVSGKPTTISGYGITDALTLASTAPAGLGTTAAVGTGTTAAKADHVHAITSSNVTTALGYTPYKSGDSPSFGTVTASGSVLVGAGQRLDTSAAGALNIGSTTATSVVLGSAGVTVNAPGTLQEAGSRVWTAATLQASSTTPLVEAGSGSVGTSAQYARADHVHPVASATAISSTGTIASNEIAVFNSATQAYGSSKLTWDGLYLTVTGEVRASNYDAINSTTDLYIGMDSNRIQLGTDTYIAKAASATSATNYGSKILQLWQSVWSGTAEIVSSAFDVFASPNAGTNAAADLVINRGSDGKNFLTLKSDGDLQVPTGSLIVTSGSATTTPSYQIHSVGSIGIVGIGSPASGSVSQIGTAGSTSYQYYVTSIDAFGYESQGKSLSTTTGNSTLSALNYNVVTWSSLAGAASYNIYVNTGSRAYTLLANITGTSYNDQGATGTAVSSSFFNTYIAGVSYNQRNYQGNLVASGIMYSNEYNSSPDRNSNSTGPRIAFDQQQNHYIARATGSGPTQVGHIFDLTPNGFAGASAPSNSFMSFRLGGLQFGSISSYGSYFNNMSLFNATFAKITPLSTPSAPTLSATTGSLAAGTYTYSISAVDGSGGTTPASSTASITLGSTGGVIVSVSSIVGASSYYIYRNGSYIGLVNNYNPSGTLTFTDSGNSATSAPPTTNTTGRLLTNLIYAASGSNVAFGSAVDMGNNTLKTFNIDTASTGNLTIGGTTMSGSLVLGNNTSGAVQVKPMLQVFGGISMQTGSGATITYLDGSTQASAPASVYARAGITAAQTIPSSSSTVVNFNNVVSDTKSTITTGSAWKFTAPSAGIYLISAAVVLQALGSTGEAYLDMYIGGVFTQRSGVLNPTSTSGANYRGVYITSAVAMTSGQTMWLQVVQSSGASRTTTATITDNWINIVRLGDTQ